MVLIAGNKQFLITLEEETEAALCMVKERPFSRETINLAYFFLSGKKMTSFLSFSQVIEVTSQTIYETKSVFHVNEMIVFFWFCFCLFFFFKYSILLGGENCSWILGIESVRNNLLPNTEETGTRGMRINNFR